MFNINPDLEEPYTYAVFENRSKSLVLLARENIEQTLRLPMHKTFLVVFKQCDELSKVCAFLIPWIPNFRTPAHVQRQIFLAFFGLKNRPFTPRYTIPRLQTATERSVDSSMQMASKCIYRKTKALHIFPTSLLGKNGMKRKCLVHPKSKWNSIELNDGNMTLSWSTSKFINCMHEPSL